ncbi:hypothetical protein N2152v2_001422 [Parachlorella kessleri]
MKASLLLAVLALAATARLGQANVLEVAQNVTDLSTLVLAVEAAGLAETIANLTGPATLLAPTNEAFLTALAQIEQATGLSITGFEDIPEETLVALLAYHVLPKQYSGAQLLALAPAVLDTYLTNATLVVGRADDTVVFQPSGGLAFANVTEADVAVPGTKVTVHVINNVLVPVEVLQELVAAQAAK